jgi:hypothetical protein
MASIFFSSGNTKLCFQYQEINGRRKNKGILWANHAHHNNKAS